MIVVALLALLLMPTGARAQDKKSFDAEALEALLECEEAQHTTRLVVRPKQTDRLVAAGVDRAGATARLASARQAIAPVMLRHEPVVDEYVLTVPKGKTLDEYAHELLATGDFEYVVPDLVCTPTAIPNDPNFSRQYHHALMDSVQAWDITTGSNGIVVAVVDTGIDLDHPDLAPLLLPGYNSASRRAQVSGGDVSDINGHGTAVAGCITAVGNNGVGVAGVGWNFGLIPVRTTNQTNGNAFSSDYLAGARWAADQGARVVNISYSGVANPSVQTTGRYLADRGAVLVMAGGNDNEQHDGFDHEDVVVVSATTSSDAKASFSAEGRGIDVAAPGVGVWTTTNGGSYGGRTGTSFSSPLTAGVLAMVFTVDPTLSADMAVAALREGAEDLGAPGEDRIYGSGRINLLGALTSPCLTGVGGTDCNGNGVIDECAVYTGGEQDCNANAIPDDCEIAAEPGLDCDINGLIDVCEGATDCDGNGLADECQILNDPSLDCNSNGVIDTCEFGNDCNGNGIPDDCELASDPSLDCNSNGVLDTCESELYFVVSSSEPGGPAYRGDLDISASGTALVLADDMVSGPIAIGFPFEFFEQTYSDVRVSSNGFLTFGASGDSGCCEGDPLPSAVSPNAVIAGWWTDLDPSQGGSVHYELRTEESGRVFVVQYKDVPYFGSSSSASFQIHLFESGAIEVHHGVIGPTGGRDASVGIEDEEGVRGLESSRGTVAPASFSAVRFVTGGEDCNGNGVLDDCDIEADPQLDCDGNGVIDTCENASKVTLNSPRFEPIDEFNPASWTVVFNGTPINNDATLTVTAIGDLGAVTEYVEVFVDAKSIGRIFENGPVDCGPLESVEALKIPGDLLRPEGIAIDFIAPVTVDAFCSNDFLRATLEVTLQSEPEPCDGGRCAGDFDGDGAIGANDFFMVIQSFGALATAEQGDINADGVIGADEFFYVIQFFGSTCD